jgi:hypothetical protein
VVFGKYFVVSPGVSIGSVTTAPIGQMLGQAPINGANTLNTLSSRRVTSFALAIGFTWIDRTDQFAAAFAQASVSGNIGSCVTAVDPSELKFDGKADKTITVKAGADCVWIATLRKSGSGFQIKGGSGKGDGTITISAPEQDAVRADVVDIIGPPGSVAKTVKLSQAAKSCVDDLNGGKDATGDGTTTAINVGIKSTNCSWKATVDNAKFTVTPDSGGDAVTSIQVQPPASQTDADQSTTLTVIGPADATPKKIVVKQPKRPQQ